MYSHAFAPLLLVLQLTCVAELAGRVVVVEAAGWAAWLRWRFCGSNTHSSGLRSIEAAAGLARTVLVLVGCAAGRSAGACTW